MTVTEQVAVFEPSAVVTVMVAVPAFTAVTFPEVLTVATAVFDDFQLTALFVAVDGEIVAVRVSDAPSVRVSADLFRLTLVTDTVGALTVTEQLAVFEPSAVVTVMVAVPALTAVTFPEVLTVATDVFEDFQLTFLFVAVNGETVAVRVSDAPSVRVNVDLFRLTPVTETVAALTVTVQLAVFVPSSVVTVIVAVPALTAVTLPVLLTVATDVFDDLQLTFLFVAVDGATVAVSVSDVPSVRVSVDLFRLTLVTEIVAALTVTEQVAVFEPSAVVTVIVAVPGLIALTAPL